MAVWLILNESWKSKMEIPGHTSVNKQRSKKLGLIALTLILGSSILSTLLVAIPTTPRFGFLLSGSMLVLGIVLAILASKGGKEH